MAKFRARAVEVEAIQYTEQPAGERPLEGAQLALGYSDNRHLGGHLLVRTDRGWCEIAKGDWLVWGVAGEICLYKPGVFAETYEAVGETA